MRCKPWVCLEQECDERVPVRWGRCFDHLPRRKPFAVWLEEFRALPVRFPDDELRAIDRAHAYHDLFALITRTTNDDP